MTITLQPALAPSPQPGPPPTERALPPKPGAQKGPNWTPIRSANLNADDTKHGALHGDRTRDRNWELRSYIAGWVCDATWDCLNKVGKSGQLKY
jgi:hypothetical protein